MISPWYLSMGIATLMLVMMDAYTKKSPDVTNIRDPFTLMRLVPFALILAILGWPLILMEMVVKHVVRKH